MTNTQRSNERRPPDGVHDRGQAHISTKLQRIAELARDKPQTAFTSLSHFIDIDWLREAHRRTRKDGATGIGGVTAADYESNLDANLSSLLGRFRSGRYKAPPVRRTHIPKGDGRTRPLGIPTFEDKLLQRAVLMLLEPIYEHDFLSCSFGFRPGRSAHGAIDAVWKATMDVRGGWVLEIDFSDFFGTVAPVHLRTMLDQRMKDGVLRRMLNKWLAAGVLENGSVHYPETGTPQGGVISPLLANIYGHHVLDLWFMREVKPRLRQRAELIRYADDAVFVFASEADARSVMQQLPERCAAFGLTLHPEKTRLIDFRQPPDGPDRQPRHFDFLAFRHYWGRSRAGRPVVLRKTAPSRFTRALQKVGEWLKRGFHRPLAEQHRGLQLRLRGHYGYFGVTGNWRGLARFQFEVGRLWRRALSRRHRSSLMDWPTFNRLLRRFPLMRPRMVRSVSRSPANA